MSPLGILRAVAYRSRAEPIPRIPVWPARRNIDFPAPALSLCVHDR